MILHTTFDALRDSRLPLGELFRRGRPEQKIEGQKESLGERVEEKRRQHHQRNAAVLKQLAKADRAR